jgi:hypothetical protein
MFIFNICIHKLHHHGTPKNFWSVTHLHYQIGDFFYLKNEISKLKFSECVHSYNYKVWEQDNFSLMLLKWAFGFCIVSSFELKRPSKFYTNCSGYNLMIFDEASNDNKIAWNMNHHQSINRKIYQ